MRDLGIAEFFDYMSHGSELEKKTNELTVGS
jgi:hypothetical protein